jgi:hypothetical protein
LAVIALCGGALFVGQAKSQDKPEGMPDMMAGMKKWMASIKPNENHKWLEQFVGKWHTTTTMMGMDPNGKGIETHGTAEFRMANGGRILVQEAKGELMMPDQTMQMKKIPYEGMGMFGYDSYRHMYVGSWSDTTTTAILQMSGALDQSKKKLTFYGQMDEPMMDITARTVKYVFTIESDKKFTFSVYDLHAGENFKPLEIVYERQ